MASIQLYQGDCLDIMRGMADDSIDLTVTSPPYDGLRHYDGTYVHGSVDWRAIIKELYRITARGGVVVWVVADETKNGTESGTSFRQALWAYECLFNLHDTMIYEIAGTGAKGSNYAYWQSFEYMFVWSKGAPNTVNRIADVKNSAGGKMRPNVWRYAVGQEDTMGHPAPFPLQLAKDHIASWSKPGDLVFDPFAGSGTTGIAAVQLQRNFVGCEIVPAYHAIAEKRIAEAQMQLPLLEVA
jgi:DNA modification methylase